MRRRHFLTLSASSIGGMLVYTLDRKPARVHAQDQHAQDQHAQDPHAQDQPTHAKPRPEKSIKVPLRFFTEQEALAVAAASATIFPADDSGPGANEAGVVIYIDRQLAGPYGRDRYRFTQLPFESGVPEQGYQGKATPADIYREGLQHIRGLHQLSTEAQHAALTRIERTSFFQMLKTHTIEGMFCDPMHGGNAGLIGWQLIGFPGPRMSYADEVDQYHSREFRPKPMSLQQIVGHPVKPLEDET